ncbi:MAG TPA: hypothetical protein DGD08_09600 [Gemmatimonas aurantiaca]|uniref:Uncharacterized protein n=1 Tax=Gemmatimonas aurantiaca TaxID=173480 RepID=A0A3D4V8L1_9BACT|nr:hypothetical protein [Gemmatimonas aurantiaca]
MFACVVLNGVGALGADTVFFLLLPFVENMAPKGCLTGFVAYAIHVPENMCAHVATRLLAEVECPAGLAVDVTVSSTAQQSLHGALSVCG